MITYEDFYTPSQKALHDAHDSARLANVVIASNVRDEIQPEHRPFIEASDFFFLATVDARGMPTVSYKGGAPGFVRILDPKTIVFPNYDGNGMFLSMGNVGETSKVGLLFIDMVTPNRVRLQGEATVSPDDPEMASYPGANMVVRVNVDACFLNCARYIHKHQRVETSRYVPDAKGDAPFPAWKR
ncbi:MAG: pyridoxamine 5'-phosphate oxidase family protein, partial [Pseudomonadota bacterium]